jgi:hypothetical protein
MRGRAAGRMIAFASLALAVVTSSTASAAPASPQQLQAAVQQAQNPWMALSMMTPVGAATLGSAGVAAQPGPPPEDEDDNRKIPLPVILIWLGTAAAMIYIATHNNHHPRPHASPD